MIKRVYVVPDMQCTNCVMHLQEIEDEMPGIEQVSASYAKQEMIVEFDEDLVDEDQIMAQVSSKGYSIYAKA